MTGSEVRFLSAAPFFSLYSAGFRLLLKKAKAAISGIKTAEIGIATAQIRHNAFLACLCIFFCSNAQAEEDYSAFPKWVSVVERQEKNDEAILRQKHKYLVNHYRYIEDKNDYWKTPAEFRRDGGGDCEDFAIALYFDGIAAGVREDRMQLVVGWLSDLQEIHAALRYGDYYYDNRAAEPFAADEYEKVFKPIYEINRLGWKRF